ncbi:hypothetical protein HYV87_00295 [Candidatus Woesearchaeota archaeon]|nr:hypothetical protein [Candidatus Woesearchaeota archaeon]
MNKEISKQEVKDLETTLQEKLYSDLLGENSTLDQINFIYKIVDTLRGAYSDEGIRNWFYRERKQLEGKNPLEYLGSSWKPEEENAQKVLELAKRLKV